MNLVSDRVHTRNPRGLKVSWRNGFLKRASWTNLLFIFCQISASLWKVMTKNVAKMKKSLGKTCLNITFFGWFRVPDPSLGMIDADIIICCIKFLFVYTLGFSDSRSFLHIYNIEIPHFTIFLVSTSHFSFLLLKIWQHMQLLDILLSVFHTTCIYWICPNFFIFIISYLKYTLPQCSA